MTKPRRMQKGNEAESATFWVSENTLPTHFYKSALAQYYYKARNRTVDPTRRFEQSRSKSSRQKWQSRDVLKRLRDRS